MERDLLEYLSKVPLPGYADLSSYFKNKYPNYKEISKDIKVLLDELGPYNKLITILDTGLDHSHLGLDENIHGTHGIVTFDTYDQFSYKLSSKITMRGREYLAALIRNEKQDDLNQSFKILNEKTIPDQNRRQNILTVCTVIFALITTIFIGLDTCKGKPDVKCNCILQNQKDSSPVLQTADSGKIKADTLVK